MNLPLSARLALSLGAIGLCAWLVAPMMGGPVSTTPALAGATVAAALSDAADPVPEAPVEVEAPDAAAELADHAALAQLTLSAPVAVPSADAVRPASPGAWLAAAPPALPGTPADTDVTLAEIRGHLLAGQTDRALAEAELFAATRKGGRERDAALMLVGMLHREAGRHNSASEAFTRVRAAGGPLAPLAAWYEAEQDYARGRYAVAISECTKYRQTWPDGEHADACLRVIARGHAALGHTAAAREAAAAYDQQRPKATISEQIELDLALYLARHEPGSAVARLQHLAVHHRDALTGRVAEEELARLAAAGVEGAVVPDDTASLMARAVSLRESGRKQDAFAAYQRLIERNNGDDPRLDAWLAAQATTFGWRTHHFDDLASVYEARYRAEKNAGDAWELQKALGRAGRWKEAAAWCTKGLEAHGNTREWRGKTEEIARTYLLAGDYARARDRFAEIAGRGGTTGRRGEFFAGFAAHMHGDHEDAVRRLTALLDQRRGYDAEGRYWRAKAYEALGDAERAGADRDWVLSHEPTSWYGVLLAQSRPELPKLAPFARDGTWPGAELPEPPPVAALPTARDVPPSAWAVRRLAGADVGFSSLSWPLLAPEPNALTAQAALHAQPLRDLSAPPPSYTPGPLYDEAAARERFRSYASQHASAWPLLPAIADLADVGLYDLAGPLLAEIYEDWRDAMRSYRHPKHTAALRASMPSGEWRDLFLFARDHHHAARFVYGLERNFTEPALIRDALKLGWPLAHDRYVWQHAREHDIDPYLVLGLMRQESVYNPIAESPVGARGAMQIMPRTGHLLANLAHDTEFTAGDLEDPTFAVGYGIWYLALLMERFEGVFPLAVGAYNTGPTNMASWMEGVGPDTPIDAFVEMIPYKETRHYVKVVSSNYATYLALYAPEGTGVVVPPATRGDREGVVDF